MDPREARNLIPLTEHYIHMNHAGVSPMSERGHAIVEPWPRSRAESSGIVSFRKPGASAQEVLRDLNAAHIVARIHRDFVRLSPHFYNTYEEVERVLEVLAPESVSR